MLSVVITQCGIDTIGKKTYSLSEAIDYAMNNVVHGNNVDRIVIKENTGESVRVIYDKRWQAQG